MENEDKLLELFALRTLSDDTCNVCQHCESRRMRCGHIIETCHHPELDENADDGWPEVDGSMICDLFTAREGRKNGKNKDD